MTKNAVLAINTIAPHWDGNQVWFITAGGALFAAWPLVYATAFSGMYWALLLVLFALFLRPVGFDYRSKLENTKWRTSWDWGLCIGGAVPALVFGVAFGNMFLRCTIYPRRNCTFNLYRQLLCIIKPICFSVWFSKFVYALCAWWCMVNAAYRW